MSGESTGGDRAPTEEPDCELPRSSPAVRDRASEELDGGEVATFGCQPVRLGSVSRLGFYLSVQHDCAK